MTASDSFNLHAGQLLVGDAFAFVDGVGRVQFQAADPVTTVFFANSKFDHSLSNLATWSAIGTNVGSNGLVIWMDYDVTNYTRRVYTRRPPYPVTPP